MPFSQTSVDHTEEYWTSLYEEYLKPLIEKHERINVFRSAARREDLLSEIIKNIITQHIVIADLTDYNPNVFWELGVRQSFQHRTITIAEYGTKIPFDIGKKGTLFYHPKDIIKSESFRSDIIVAIQDCIENPDRPDSIVLESISGRGSLYEIIRKDEVKRRITALKSEYEFNYSCLNGVIRSVKENLEIQKKMAKKEEVKDNQKYETRRMRHSAIELLVTNRYLDASEEFYDIADTYYDNLLRLNDQLQIWESLPAGFESYIKKTEKIYIEEYKAFIEQLNPLIVNY